MKYFNQNVNFTFFPSFIKKKREDVEVGCEHGSGHLCKALCSVPSTDSPPPPPTRMVVSCEKIEPMREVWVEVLGSPH